MTIKVMGLAARPSSPFIYAITQGYNYNGISF